MVQPADKTDQELIEWLDGKFMKWVVTSGAGETSEPVAPLGKALKRAREFFDAAGHPHPRIAREDEPVLIEYEQIARLWKHPKFAQHPKLKDW